MASASYLQRRGQLETYFDRTAAQAWSRLTSDAPVGRIRATVRAGRAQMRATLLGWLPQDLRGCRLLDAGCGTGAFAIEAARRGADVAAVDLSPTLIALARERIPGDLGAGTVTFAVGDLLEPAFGRFDHVVAMDSLIHYPAPEVGRMLGELAARTERSLLFTYAPRTSALAAMHAIGRIFPRSDRAPAIEPIVETTMHRLLTTHAGLHAWRSGRTERVARGFYIAQAQELVRR
jgi:magnesium-protoporphyrin O-methyltransferase